MATTATRWNLVVSKETDTALRQFLASEGGGRKGDLSKFVEEAVQERIFDLTLRAAREHNASRTPEEIEAAIEEALAWARSK
jgi:hypothetical protein